MSQGVGTSEGEGESYTKKFVLQNSDNITRLHQPWYTDTFKCLMVDSWGDFYNAD